MQIIGSDQMKDLVIKRAYDIKDDKKNEKRVLIDRLWPRGVSKDKLQIDLWDKSITPSSTLRKDFHANVITGEDFEKKYKNEIENNKNWNDFKKKINEFRQKDTVYLVTGAKIIDHSHTFVIKEMLEK